MIPLRDSVPTRSFPLVTVALIAVNVLVWLAYQVPNLQSSVIELGFFPCEVESSCPDPGVPWPLDAVTSMFAHGGWLLFSLFLHGTLDPGPAPAAGALEPRTGRIPGRLLGSASLACLVSGIGLVLFADASWAWLLGSAALLVAPEPGAPGTARGPRTGPRTHRPRDGHGRARKLTRVAVRYEVVPQTRSGNARPRPYAADEPLDPGDTIVLKGRWWLVERVEPSANGGLPRAFLVEPRYRLRLRHPDGREEVGAFRRFRPDAPGIGHSFTTIEDGHPAAWAVVDQGLARDEEGRPYIDLIAERDFGELEELPDHELEHALAARDASIPEAASATISRAEAAGLAVELVLLEAGDEPGWDDARTYIDALILEEIEDDLFEQCGVDTDRDPRETWLATVNDRLHADLGSFRADVEGDHDEIEEWEFLGGRIFASVGSFEDESDPVSGHGWMCRLVDSSALGAAGFKRVRKIEL